MIKIITKVIQKTTSKLVNKLILIFISIIIAIIVCLTFIYYKNTEAESIVTIISSNSSNLNLINKNFDEYFFDINQCSFPQTNYDNLMNSIANESEDYDKRLYLEDYLKTFILQRKDISSIYLYIAKENKYYYIERSNTHLDVNMKYNENISKQEWYKDLMDSNTNTYINPLTLSENTGYLITSKNEFMAFHRVLRNIYDKKPSAIITIYFNAIKKQEILSDLPFISGEHAILLDSNNRLFFIDDKNYLSSSQKTFLQGAFLQKIDIESTHNYFYWEIDNMKFLVVYNISKMYNLKLIKLIPYSEITNVAKINIKKASLICMIFIALSVFAVTVTSNYITKPLKKLSEKMRTFGKEDLNMQVTIKGTDEISELSKQFNEMIIKINDLINEQYKIKLVEKNAILKALEAELNPHFLYNALQAISTKALIIGAEEVYVMVNALALTFRYCINGKDIVIVRDEIKHVENYLTIQKARYGERLQVIYELEDLALDFEIPKLAIQCLVENSIKYVLEKKIEVCTILIKVVLEGTNARITVKDNGTGIDSDGLSKILETLNSEWIDGGYDCIGIKNLNTRLKLIFGDGARIFIRSDKNGTNVSMIIPERSHS